MKFLILSLTFFASAQAHAGAVDDSIDCIAKGKISCGVKSMRKDEKIEKVNQEPAEENQQITEQEI